MGRDHDAGQFEWVNAWAALRRAESAPVEAARDAVTAVQTEIAPAPVRAVPDDQLMRDIGEIERVRDALALIPVAAVLKGRTQTLARVPVRTTDPVPVVIGGVLALVMLTVFGAAAAMTKLAR